MTKKKTKSGTAAVAQATAAAPAPKPAKPAKPAGRRIALGEYQGRLLVQLERRGSDVIGCAIGIDGTAPRVRVPADQVQPMASCAIGELPQKASA